MVPADRLTFEAEKEPWTLYRLEDGTVLKVRAILANVARLVDRYKPDGEPIYVLGLGAMPVLEVPPDLMQPTTQSEDRKE